MFEAEIEKLLTEKGASLVGFSALGESFCDMYPQYGYAVTIVRKLADAVVETKDRIYVFEFKLEGTVDEALKQIDEKGYLLPYQTDGRELVKVGVSFNAEERNIGEYKVV